MIEICVLLSVQIQERFWTDFRQIVQDKVHKADWALFRARRRLGWGLVGTAGQ